MFLILVKYNYIYEIRYASMHKIFRSTYLKRNSSELKLLDGHIKKVHSMVITILCKMEELTKIEP